MKTKKIECTVDGLHYYVDDLCVNKEVYEKEKLQNEIIDQQEMIKGLQKINKRLDKLEKK